MEPDITSPFVRTSNPWLARWQAIVMEIACGQIQKENPDMPIHEVRTLALKHPMVLGTTMHALHTKQNHSFLTDEDRTAISQLNDDTPHHIVHYYASRYYYQQSVSKLAKTDPRIAEALVAMPADDKPSDFPDTDSNIGEWITAGAEWEAWANPYPSPYIDWTTKVPNGAHPSDFIKTFAVYTIPDNAKVVILGDFGTGLTDGILMLMSILINQQPDLIIHVGDIYYAGMGSETDAYVNMFTQAFSRTGKKVPVFSIPGNHEYMSGGAPYFNKVLQMNAANGFSQYAQSASYFCLRTTSGNLQFLSMDTGLNSVDAWLPTSLQGAYSPWLWFSEADWCKDKLETFKNTGKKTILLSHHQLYSVSGEINDGNNVVYIDMDLAQKENVHFMNGNLFNIFSPYFDQIAAWYWGHEHLLGIYVDGELKNSQGVPLKKGRLVGNSGYEQWDQDGGYASKTDRFHYVNPNVKVGITSVNWTFVYVPPRGGQPIKFPRTSNFYQHGWVLLNVSPAAINATYWQFPVMSPDITTLPPVANVPPPTSLNFSESL